MKESLAHALSSSMEWDDSSHERGIDKVTAFSSAQRLGTLLWRLKYNNCKSSFKPASFILAAKLKPINRTIAVKIAEQALREWLFPFCTACLGSAQLKKGDIVLICPECHGTGVRRYTDAERKEFIGIDAKDHLSKLIDIIGTHDKNTQHHMVIKLGRA